MPRRVLKSVIPTAHFGEELLLGCAGPESAGALGFPELELVTDADALADALAEPDVLGDADGLEDPALGLGDRLGA